MTIKDIMIFTNEKLPNRPKPFCKAGIRSPNLKNSQVHRSSFSGDNFSPRDNLESTLRKVLKLFLICLICTLLYACKNNEVEEAPDAPNIPDLDVSL